MHFKLNTSNKDKLAEFQRLFASHGATLSATKMDIKEVEADPLTVIVHKASVVDEGVIVEDTSLEVEGAKFGVNIKWLLDHLYEFVGHKAKWLVYLGLKKEGKVYVYKGEVQGEIVSAEGTQGFGFDPFFKPENSVFTLAQSKLDNVNARALAVDAFFKNEPFVIKPVQKEWNGPWQG